MAEESNSEIQINVKGPAELKLQVSITTDKTVSELKKVLEEKSEIPADQQRLIYSGKVLKDEDAITVYKIRTDHTIHMVKKAPPAATSSTRDIPLPTMQTGQNPSDPLTQLNSHQAFGAMAGFNPFSEFGLNTNDPNMLQAMMSSPQFLQQMTSMLSNPTVLDQIVTSNPHLQPWAAQIREAFQNEQVREIISNPERMQQMMQMAHAFGYMGEGGSPMASLGGRGGFPAPGLPTTGGIAVPPTNPESTQPPLAGTGTTPPFNLFGSFGAANAGGTPNPSAFNPALLQQLMAGGGFGQNAFGSPIAAPTDARPPEERFQVQLQQMQEMGFTDARQNVRALLATNGNIHSAIEYIFGGGGL